MRTITEILTEADSVDTYTELLRLSDELEDNRKKYSISQLEFAREHLRHLKTERDERVNDFFRGD